MSTILDRILVTKAGELIERKAERSQADLEIELANAPIKDHEALLPRCINRLNKNNQHDRGNQKGVTE